MNTPRFFRTTTLWTSRSSRFDYRIVRANKMIHPERMPSCVSNWFAVEAFYTAALERAQKFVIDQHDAIVRGAKIPFNFYGCLLIKADLKGFIRIIATTCSTTKTLILRLHSESISCRLPKQRMHGSRDSPGAFIPRDRYSLNDAKNPTRLLLVSWPQREEFHGTCVRPALIAFTSSS